MSLKYKIGIVLIFAVLVCSFSSCGTKNPEYVGTWVHKFDGSDGRRPFIDGKKYARNELILNENGTFEMTWVARYNRKQIWLTDGQIGHAVEGWGNGNGKWSVENDVLYLKYKNTTEENDYEEYKVKLNEDKTVLKLNDDIYKKTK